MKNSLNVLSYQCSPKKLTILTADLYTSLTAQHLSTPQFPWLSLQADFVLNRRQCDGTRVSDSELYIKATLILHGIEPYLMLLCEVRWSENSIESTS